MAKRYKQIKSGLLIPDWMPDRRGITSGRGFRFSPTGKAGGCCCVNCGEFSDSFTIPQRQPETHYTTETVASVPFNGRYFTVHTPGTSMSSPPTWPTDGSYVADGTDGLYWVESDHRWDVSSGTWASGLYAPTHTNANLLSTSDSNARINAYIPSWKNKDGTTDSDFHPYVISVTMSVRSGSASRVWFGGGYVEITWSACCQANICDSSGNILTISPTITATDGGTYALVVCVTATTVTAAGVTATLASATIAAGVGTGSVSGEMDFSAFSVQRYQTPQWQAGTTYGISDAVLPGTRNGHAYRCTIAGESGSRSPAWPTDGSSVADGSVTWIDFGANDDSNCQGCVADPCVIFADDFAGDDTAANWTIRAGSWTAAGSSLSTSSSNALITCDVVQPTFQTHVIRVWMQAVTGNYSRIVFNYSGGSYSYFEIYWNGVSSTVSLKTSDGSTIVTKPYPFTNGVPYSFLVCVMSGKVSLFHMADSTINNGDGIIADAAVTSSVVAVGLGTGSTSASLSFGSFSIGRNGDGVNGCYICELHTCVNCAGKFPDDVTITFSGFTGSMTIFNGTYVASMYGDMGCEYRTGPLFQAFTCGWAHIYFDSMQDVGWTFADDCLGFEFSGPPVDTPYDCENLSLSFTNPNYPAVTCTVIS